jgi:hypothetical protein
VVQNSRNSPRRCAFIGECKHSLDVLGGILVNDELMLVIGIFEITIRSITPDKRSLLSPHLET